MNLVIGISTGSVHGAVLGKLCLIIIKILQL